MKKDFCRSYLINVHSAYTATSIFDVLIPLADLNRVVSEKYVLSPHLFIFFIKVTETSMKCLGNLLTEVIPNMQISAMMEKNPQDL